MKPAFGNLKNITKARLFWPLAALLVLLVFNVIFTTDFLKIEIKDGHLYGRIIDILSRGSIFAILAIGMSLVIATKGIDISVGSTIAVTGALCAYILGSDVSPSHPFAIAIILSLLSAVVIGIWNGFLVALLKIQPVVATLIFIVAGRGVALLITDGQILTVSYKPFSYIAGYIPGIIFPTPALIAGAFLLISMILMKKTALGIFIQSSGINPLASRFIGINVSMIIFLVYIFSGLCAGGAGLIIASQINAADSINAGFFIELDAILAVALGGNSLNGGKFSIMGSVIGAYTIQTLVTTMYAVGVSSQILPVVKAVVVILICLIQSKEFQQLITQIFNRSRKEVMYEQAEAKF